MYDPYDIMGKGNNNSNPDIKIASVGIRVPSFLTVNNSPITSSGTIEIDYNHNPLPISSGGTGITAAGSKGQVLSVVSTEPEQLGWVDGSGTGTVTSVSIKVPEFLSVSPSTITSSGSFDISLSSKPIPITSGGTGITTIGKPKQILSVNMEGTELTYTNPEPAVTSVSLSTSTPFISVSPNSITDSGSLTIDCSTIPISHGGTNLSTLGHPNQVLTVNNEGTNLEYKTPSLGVTSVSMTVPEFLTVSPSTITSSGSFELSCLTIPITYGGTGLTTLGQPNQVLAVNSSGTELEYQTPKEGTVKSVSLSTSTPFLSVSPNSIIDSGSLTIDCSTIPISHGGTGLSNPGQPNQILSSDGTSLLWTDLPKLDNYLTTIETMTPLSYSDNTLSISSYTGSGRVVFENSPVLTNPILGDAQSSSISLNGSQSGAVKLSAQSGSYNFILPTTIGKRSDILTSQGAFLPTTWSSTIGSGDILRVSDTGSPGQILSILSTEPTQVGWIDGSGTGTVTSISMKVPEFLSVSPSTITSSGTFDLSCSTIPISYGGTGLASLGQPNQILAVNSLGTELEYQTPKEGTVTSVSLSTSTPFLSVSPNSITDSGSLTINCSTIPISHGGTNLSILGQPNQVLTVNSDGTKLEYKTPSLGVTSVSIKVPEFLTVSPSTITSSGEFDISLPSTIPISYGGTGLSIIGQPNQVLAVNSSGTELEYQTPKEGTVKSVSLSTSTPFLSVSPNSITDSGSLTIDCSTIPISHGGTGLSNPGQPNQILSSDGTSLQWTDLPKLDKYLTTINTLPPLSYENNTISISSFTGSGKIVFDTSATLTTANLVDPSTNSIIFQGTQSGAVTVSATSGNYNFILPTTYGKPSQILTSQGPYNPLQWTSTTGSGNIVCSQNPILSGQTIFTNGTILCKSKIIQSQGLIFINSDTVLSVQETFSFIIVDSENPITLTFPSVKEIHDYIGDLTIGNRISNLLHNKSPGLSIIVPKGITLVDGRASSSIPVQEYTYVMTNADEGLLLLK